MDSIHSAKNVEMKRERKINLILPLENESLEQFTYRLSSNKEDLGLSWSDISILIKKYFGKIVSVDFIRHEYYGMKKMKTIEIQKDDGFFKVLIMNDIHIPFQRDDVLEHIEKNKNVDEIIFGGDLVDVESCSFWSMMKRPTVEEELVLVHEFLTKVNSIIDPKKTKIRAIRGNHEYRYERDIMNLQEKHMQSMLSPQFLKMIENGFTIYHEDKDVFYKPIENFTYVNDWYVKLYNNLIVAHPTDFSAVEGTMLLKNAEYFLNEGVAEKGDVVIFGHTHKFTMGKVNRRQGLFVIENGCMCREMAYARSGKLKFTPQNYCYTTLKFKKGEKIDPNNINVTHLD